MTSDRRGVFHSGDYAAIEEFQAHNSDPRPFVWTATAESLLAKVQRGRIALKQIQTQS